LQPVSRGDEMLEERQLIGLIAGILMATPVALILVFKGLLAAALW
jgi:hypothetical protein